LSNNYISQIDFIKGLKSDTIGVGFENKGIRYGLFIDNKLVSFMNIVEIGKGVKFKSNYTFPEYRGNGYFTQLLNYVAFKYIVEGKKITADCLDTSYGIYKKLGFTLVKEVQYKDFKIHRMRR